MTESIPNYALILRRQKLGIGKVAISQMLKISLEEYDRKEYNKDDFHLKELRLLGEILGLSLEELCG